MSLAPIRYRRWKPLPARLMLGLLLVLTICSVAMTMSAGVSPLRGDDPTTGDSALYRAIVERVADGQSYYEAAVTEQRARDYPLRPFVTVRLPTLAWITAPLGPGGSRILLLLLAGATSLAAIIRFRASLAGGIGWTVPTAAVVIGIILMTSPGLDTWHESWAALLILLSVACRSPRHWALSVGVGLLAALVRELALPYLAVMTLFAWREGRRVEALAWIGACLAVVAALFAHALALSSHLVAGDPASQGWTAIGGWPFIVAMMHRCSLFGIVSLPVTAALIPLALFGWAALDEPFAKRYASMLAGYVAAFMVIGRPDNFYWGLLLAPVLPAGLAFVPAALVSLLSAAGGEVRRTTSLRVG